MYKSQMEPKGQMEPTEQMEPKGQMVLMVLMVRTVQKVQMALNSSTQALAQKASQRTTMARWLCSLALVWSRYG